ncbi:MAG: hypothetical protein KBD01_09385 [Acidobacteria bacterium]|nr:hypothetical protein [Acidobacteriota bacterium]
MKRIRTSTALVVLGLAALALFTATADKNPQKGKTEQRVVLVAGTDAWTETDIEIGLKDEVTFTATGKVCFSSAKQSCEGPAGWGRDDYANSWPDDYNECEDTMSDANHGALIGSIGGNLFYIGPKQTVTGKEGILSLGINDCTFTGEPFGNSGSFSVVVSIERRGG